MATTEYGELVVQDLKNFYEKHNPAKIGDVDGIVSDAVKKGIPSSKMFELLYKRYGVAAFTSKDSIVDRSKKLYHKLSLEEIHSEMRRVELEGLDHLDIDNYFLGLQRRTVGKNTPPPQKEKTVQSVATNQQVQRMRTLSTAKSKSSIDEVMADEVREWLVSILAPLVKPEVKESLEKSKGNNVVGCLRDGVLLQIMLQKLNNPGLLAADVKQPKSQGFHGRDNVTRFIRSVQEEPYSLRTELTFTDVDLCEGKNDRQVVTCLLALAKITYAQGVAPAPPIVKFDEEIEEQAKHITEVELDQAMEQDDEEEIQQDQDEGDWEDLLEQIQDDEVLGRDNMVASEERVRKLLLYVLARTGVITQEGKEKPHDQQTKQQEQLPPKESVIVMEEPKQIIVPKKIVPQETGGDSVNPPRSPLLTRSEIVEPGSPAASPNKRYVAKRGDDVDKQVSNVVNTVMQGYTAPRTKIKRLNKQGQYVIYHKITGKRTVCFVRVVQSTLMIRVGGGWEHFEDYLARRMVDWESGPAIPKKHTVNPNRIGGPGALLRR